jgi:hypothetical protein
MHDMTHPRIRPFFIHILKAIKKENFYEDRTYRTLLYFYIVLYNIYFMYVIQHGDAVVHDESGAYKNFRTKKGQEKF